LEIELVLHPEGLFGDLSSKRKKYMINLIDEHWSWRSCGKEFAGLMANSSYSIVCWSFRNCYELKVKSAAKNFKNLIKTI
jgi:hypothetical protein